MTPCDLCEAREATFNIDTPGDGADVCDVCLPAALRRTAQYGYPWPNVWPGQYPRYMQVTPRNAAPAFDQHLVDYTVRNITTGDEEDIRVLELTDDELDDMPGAVLAEIKGLLANAHTGTGLAARVEWGEVSEQIRQLLLPYISDRALYDSDYEAWENRVLDWAEDES